FAAQPAIWHGFEYGKNNGNETYFGQWQGSGGPGYGTQAVPGVTISVVSTEGVARTGIKSLKIAGFTLPAMDTTTTAMAVFDKGDYAYWWHWSGGHETLFLWVYVPDTTWISGLTGEFVVNISSYYVIGPPVALNTGWNYVSVDINSVRNQYGYPYTLENSRWLGVRITNTNTITAFSGPFYLDDYGSIALPGIYRMTTFETDLNGSDPLNGWSEMHPSWGSVTVSLDTSTTQKYAGDWSLSATFTLSSTTVAQQAFWVKTLNCAYNLMPWVGVRSYLYFPDTPPPTIYVQMFANVGANWSRWLFVPQPGMQAGWNELVMDLSADSISSYNYDSSRIDTNRPGIRVGQNTTDFTYAATLYFDEVEAVPPIESNITTMTWIIGESRDLEPYIQYGLPFGPLSGHYYIWTSSSTAVAYIADSTSGVVQGAGIGSATITATDRTGMNVSIQVNIIATEAPLAVEPKAAVIRKSESMTLELFE
ncbi:MAG: hypothetical protein QME64_06010, partial [bacterium]|nr:hypothetical protein [bacterium]